MSYFECGNCQEQHIIYGSRRGAKEFSQDNELPYLGTLPLIPEMMNLADQGLPAVLKNNNIAKIYADILENILSKISSH